MTDIVVRLVEVRNDAIFRFIGTRFVPLTAISTIRRANLGVAGPLASEYWMQPRRNEMKPALWIAIWLCAASGLQADEKDIFDQPHLTVTGTGEVDAKPDMATITVGVVTEAESASAALEANTERMKKLFDDLQERGIAEKDMQTANFNVSPKYQHHPQGREAPKIVGYTVTNEVRVRVRRLSSLGRVLDELVNDGANRVHGISFSIDDDANLLDEARKKAVQDARRKAELLADAASVRLGRPLVISDQPSPRPVPMNRFRMAEAAQAVPIAPGEVTQTATIQVTYALEAAQ
jgi:uncharacterized protein YggE